MSKHHLANAIHQKIRCLYCRNDIDTKEWGSGFSGEIHYKNTKCQSCGRLLSIPVNFSGSGHDEWHNIIIEEDKPSEFTNKPVETIENRIEKTEENNKK